MALDAPRTLLQNIAEIPFGLRRLRPPNLSSLPARHISCTLALGYLVFVVKRKLLERLDLSQREESDPRKRERDVVDPDR